MANTSASAWLDRYVLEIGRTPAYPEYLRAFAANRGGCLSYRSAVDLIATIQAADCLSVCMPVDASPRWIIMEPFSVVSNTAFLGLAYKLQDNVL